MSFTPNKDTKSSHQYILNILHLPPILAIVK